MIKKVVVLLFLTVATNLFGFETRNVSVPASPTGYSAGNSPVFFIDDVTFLGAEQKALVQFYFQMNYSELYFVRDGEQFRAAYDLEIWVYDEMGKMSDNQIYRDIFRVPTYEETQTANIARISRYSISLEPGDYWILALITDRETGRQSQITQAFTARNFQKTGLTVSDMYLSQTVLPAQAGQPFVTEQWYIEPNLANAFTRDNPNFYIYLEMYNLPALQEKPARFFTDLIFYNNAGTEIARFPRQVFAEGTTVGAMMKFSSRWCSPGDYTLTVQVRDPDSGNTVETTKSFRIVY